MNRFLNTIRPNKMPREMTCDFRFPFKGGHLVQVKRTKKGKKMGLLKSGHGRLIQVTITVFLWAKIRNFENWPLNTGPLYKGSTVHGNWPMTACIIGNVFYNTYYCRHVAGVRYFFNVERCLHGRSKGPQCFAIVGQCNNSHFFHRGKWSPYKSGRDFSCSPPF